MSKKLTNLFLAFILLTFVFSPFTVFANEQEGTIQPESSYSAQALKNMSDELKHVYEESFGPLWFAKPVSLLLITCEGIFKDLPVGVYKDIMHYLHPAQHQHID